MNNGTVKQRYNFKLAINPSCAAATKITDCVCSLTGWPTDTVVNFVTGAIANNTTVYVVTLPIDQETYHSNVAALRGYGAYVSDVLIQPSDTEPCKPCDIADSVIKHGKENLRKLLRDFAVSAIDTGDWETASETIELLKTLK